MMQFEYFNARLLQNTALKIKETVGAVTPPAGYAFGVLSALTNLEITNSDLVENVNSVYVNTLDIKIPTEETMVEYVEYVFEHDAAKRDSVIIKSNTIPAASAELLGYEYQYMGETNDTYTHGFVYVCKGIPTDTLVFTPNTVSCDWANLSAFLQTETADYNSVVAGSMTYFADAELWRATFTDANGDTVLTYQQYTGDWENVGFVFSGTFEDGDVVSFVRNTEFDYAWERVDLQPNHEQDIVEIREEIEDLKGLGRFLSVWNCATGLAETNPPESPYTYHTGDYFLVGTVGSTNYRPDGSTYTTGVPSTTVETLVVKVNDVYIYDGTNWKLQANSQRDVAFSGIVGNPYDNTALATALNEKQNTISDLATIRSYAQAGKAASDTIATYGNIVTHNVAEFATAAQGAKADTAVQPGDLATVATTGSYNDLSDKPTIPSVNNRINGAPLSNSASVFYGTSSTAAATVEKEVSIPSITTLDVGTVIVVQPTVTSTVANSTIKLNNFSAYPMRYNNTAITTSTDSIVWNAAYPSVWVFDGTHWCFVAHGIDSNTTYSTMSVAEGTTGTATSNRVLQAVNLKQIIQGTTLTGIDVATTGAVSASDTITDGIGKLQATKADKSELPTVGNGTITITQGGITKGTFTTNQSGDTTVALDAGGGGIGNIDNLTITANADQEIQTVATINANTATGATNPIYDWVGTLAEYNAQNIETLHPDWVCFITDDLSAEAYEAYTKGETLNMFVQKGHQVIEFQEPTAANGYTWYRKYADGWVEQGGIDSGSTYGSTTRQVNLPVAMADSNYCIQLTKIDIDTAGVAPQVISAAATNFKWSMTYNSALSRHIRWFVAGMAA